MQFANISNSDYNSGKLFSFARFYKNQLVFIIVNFSDQALNFALHIPEHLFIHWGITNRSNQKYIDLWSGDEFVADLNPNINLTLNVQPNFVKIFKLLLQ